MEAGVDDPPCDFPVTALWGPNGCVCIRFVNIKSGHFPVSAKKGKCTGKRLPHFEHCLAFPGTSLLQALLSFWHCIADVPHKVAWEVSFKTATWKNGGAAVKETRLAAREDGNCSNVRTCSRSDKEERFFFFFVIGNCEIVKLYVRKRYGDSWFMRLSVKATRQASSTAVLAKLSKYK